MKRMKELQDDLKVFSAGEKDGQNIYYVVHKDGLLTHMIAKSERERNRFKTRLNGLLRDFPELCKGELKEIIKEIV